MLQEEYAPPVLACVGLLTSPPLVWRTGYELHTQAAGAGGLGRVTSPRSLFARRVPRRALGPNSEPPPGREQLDDGVVNTRAPSFRRGVGMLRGAPPIPRAPPEGLGMEGQDRTRSSRSAEGHPSPPGQST